MTEQARPASNEAPAASAPVTPVPAATTILVRDVMTADGPTVEVCMQRRHLNSDFVGGAYVFPGGRVDDDDASEEATALCEGRTEKDANATLDLENGGLAYWVAALRECFEEAGILLAYRGSSQQMIDVADPANRERLSEQRVALNGGEVGFAKICQEEGYQLAVDRVHYVAHWITPEIALKRFDTRFFVAELPDGQFALHDDYETVDTVWIRPNDALERARAGELSLVLPTMKNLEAIADYSTVADLIAAARATTHVPTVRPRVISVDGKSQIVLPGEDGYDG